MLTQNTAIILSDINKKQKLYSKGADGLLRF